MKTIYIILKPHLIASHFQSVVWNFQRGHLHFKWGSTLELQTQMQNFVYSKEIQRAVTKKSFSLLHTREHGRRCISWFLLGETVKWHMSNRPGLFSTETECISRFQINQSRVSHPLIPSYRIKIDINGVRFKLIFPLSSSTVLFHSLILSYRMKSLPQRINGVLRRFNFLLCLPKISYFLCTLYRSAVSGWSWDKNFHKVNFNPRFNEYYGV